MIIEQSEQFTKPQLQSVKSSLHQKRCQFNAAKAEQVKGEIPDTLQKAMDLVSENWGSIHMVNCPTIERARVQSQQERVPARMCYVFDMDGSWGIHRATVSAVHRSCIDLFTWRSNNNQTQWRDITANCLSEVCRNIEREPPLLPLTGENIMPLSANRRDDARADIRATSFWGYQQCAFFDVRVFSPNTQSYCHSSIPSLYRRHEQRSENMGVEYRRGREWQLHFTCVCHNRRTERLHCSTSALQIRHLKRTTPYTAKPWRGSGALSCSPS